MNAAYVTRKPHLNFIRTVSITTVGLGASGETPFHSVLSRKVLMGGCAENESQGEVMAKKRKKKKAQKSNRLSPKQYKEINLIRENIDFFLLARAECAFCGEEDEGTIPYGLIDSINLGKKLAKRLYADGWREVDSDSYRLIGLACPDCAKLPDEER